MRAFAALTIYVSLAAVGRAERPPLWSSVTASVDLASHYRTTGDYAASEKLLRELMSTPPGDPRLAALVRNDLADLLREEGRDIEAEPLFLQTLDAPGISVRERAAALIGLADIDRQHGRWSCSIDRWNAALDITRQEQDSRAEAVVLRGLGMTWLESGSPARGEPLLRRALKMIEDDTEIAPEMVAGVRSALGELYRAENKPALAENEWTRALQMDRAALGEVHPQVAWLMEMLSDIYSVRGEYTLGRDYAARAAETMRVSFGDDSMPVACALANRALIAQRAGDTNAAIEDYEQAIRISREHPEHADLGSLLLHRYAELLKTVHRGREAKALLASGDAVVRSFALK